MLAPSAFYVFTVKVLVTVPAVIKLGISGGTRVWAARRDFTAQEWDILSG